MTLLNTVANIAVAIPKTVVLWLVDVVSFKDCTGVTDFNLDCDNYNELQVSCAVDLCVFLCAYICVCLCLHVCLYVWMNGWMY